MPVLFAPDQEDEFDPVLPNTVNLLPLNNHRVVVPKPWGPRVTVAGANQILGELHVPVADKQFQSLRQERVFQRVPPEVNTSDLLSKWHRRRRRIVQRRMVPRDLSAVEERNDLSAVEEWNEGLLETFGDHDDWIRFNINHPQSVDLFEAYIACQFAAGGLTPIFVDDWEQCHKFGGGVHCGTNERRIAAVPDVHRWWKLLDDDRRDFEDDDVGNDGRPPRDDDDDRDRGDDGSESGDERGGGNEAQVARRGRAAAEAAEGRADVTHLVVVLVRAVLVVCVVCVVFGRRCGAGSVRAGGRRCRHGAER
jgi:hypothetical protein